MREIPDAATDHRGEGQIKHSTNTVSSMYKGFSLGGYNGGTCTIGQVGASSLLTNPQTVS